MGKIDRNVLELNNQICW